MLNMEGTRIVAFFLWFSESRQLSGVFTGPPPSEFRISLSVNHNFKVQFFWLARWLLKLWLQYDNAALKTDYAHSMIINM